MRLICFVLCVLHLQFKFLIVTCKSLLQHARYRRSVLQTFNDPEFINQYYLAEDHMNIRKTWASRINGDGVTICINDPSGVSYRHPDLSLRFRLDLSFNFKTNSSDPTPRSLGDNSILLFSKFSTCINYASLIETLHQNGNRCKEVRFVNLCLGALGIVGKESQGLKKMLEELSLSKSEEDYIVKRLINVFISDHSKHGTLMAGLAAAEAGNAICGVGVAFKATLSAVLSESVGWDYHEATARSLSYRNDVNDIYSCSWGFISFYQNNIAYMHPRVKQALRENAERGRGGKGNIVVFSAGNGGLFNGTCSYDEYISSIYTIGISVITGRHTPPKQNVKCAGIMAVTYGRDGMDGIDNPNFQMPAPDLGIKCSRNEAASSSASAAVASGIFALVLQANNDLSWRDVQHLVARSSQSNISSVTWTQNGAGLRVSDDFGFGVLDAKALADGAMSWKKVGAQLNCTLPYIENIEIDGIATLSRKINFSNTISCRNIRYLEHVLLILKLNFTLRRNLEVTLTSPAGTKSIMLRSGRIFDNGKTIENLSLLSLHHWGENSNGIWSLDMRNTIPDASQKGFLFSFTVQLFGTQEDPMLGNEHVKPSKVNPASTTAPKSAEIQSTRTTTKYTLKSSTKENILATKHRISTLTIYAKNHGEDQKNYKVIVISSTLAVLFVAIVMSIVFMERLKHAARITTWTQRVATVTRSA